MRTIVPTFTDAIPQAAEGAYTHDLAAALVALSALAAMIAIAALFVIATYKLARLFFRSAGIVTVALVATVVLIGLWNR